MSLFKTVAETAGLDQFLQKLNYYTSLLADCTNARAYATVLRPSVVCL